MALECAGQVATEDVWGRVLRERGGGVSRAENALEALALGGALRLDGGQVGRSERSRTKKRQVLLAANLITGDRDCTGMVKEGLQRP